MQKMKEFQSRKTHHVEFQHRGVAPALGESNQQEKSPEPPKFQGGPVRLEWLKEMNSEHAEGQRVGLRHAG